MGEFVIPAAVINYAEIWRGNSETTVAHAYSQKMIPVSGPAQLVGVYMGKFHPVYRDLATSQMRSRVAGWAVLSV